MNHPTEPDKLLKPQVPYDTGMLEVGDGHRLYYEQCGPEDGLPIVFLHGGPGSGCSARHRQLFDLQRFRVILFDQRGCARSQPRGSLLANTSAHLIADIERLRQHVGVDQWLVLGGSWGAGLALAYAAAHKSSCLGLVLRGVFLGRESDTQWFFQHVGQLLPEAWQALLAQTPPAARTHVLHWICAQVNSQDTLQALSAACAWETWETAVTQRRHAVPRASLPRGDEAQSLLDKYRVQGHYLINGCFWGDIGLLERAQSLAGLPTAIIHGQLDWICTPQAAWDLHHRLPGSHLQWLDSSGHSPFEPAMAGALRQALAHYAMHRQFETWGEDFRGVAKA